MSIFLVRKNIFSYNGLVLEDISMSNKKPVILCIMDGFGIRHEAHGNASMEAKSRISMHILRIILIQKSTHQENSLVYQMDKWVTLKLDI